jgi:hypothetical protein
MTDLPEIRPVPLLLPDFDALAAAFKSLMASGFTGQLCCMSRGTASEPEVFLTLQKVGLPTITLVPGDEVISLGGGMLMTRDQYQAAFGGTS